MQQENKKISKIISVEMFYQNISTKSKGFTLVELIIVITILAILGTIAYISFQGYTKDARDGIRMSDIKQIYNGLSIYKTQTEKTLLPDNYISIQSGTTTISYQGYAGANVLRTLKISGGKDPGTKDYYIYTTDVNTKKAQLMTYMETSDKNVQLLSKIFVNKVLALTNTGYYQDKKIYVYGDKIGILTDSNKVPLQETTTSTGINIIILTTPITTYFGGSVYSGGLSTSTGLTLVNQINGALSGTLPCSGEIYDGYNITSLQDSQTGTFIKSISIANGSQTGTLNISCSNGTLNYSSKVETLSSIVCNSSYILSSGSCILNATSPTNFSLTQTTNSKLFNISFSGGTNNGTCKLQYENSGSWIDITSGASVNCDTNINNIQYSLNGDGWKGSWNNTQVRLLRIIDNQVIHTFTQNLSCAITTGNASSTPNIDEDCDGTWDNSITAGYYSKKWGKYNQGNSSCNTAWTGPWATGESRKKYSTLTACQADNTCASVDPWNCWNDDGTKVNDSFCNTLSCDVNNLSAGICSFYNGYSNSEQFRLYEGCAYRGVATSYY